MRQSRFTEAQIIGMIKEQEAGMPTAEVCRRHGLSPASFYKFKAKYGGMNVSVKWSGKFGQRAKVYPTRTNGYENDKATELFRQFQSYCGA